MNKGFTLVSFFTIIVCSSFLLLILTFIIFNLKDDKKDANEYISAVEEAIKSASTGVKFNPEECNILSSKTENGGVTYRVGDLLCDDTVYLKIEIKGERPISGQLYLSDGFVISSTINYK